MHAICSLIYRPSTKVYHSYVAVEDPQRNFTGEKLKDFPRLPKEDDGGIFISSKFQDSINHFFSLGTSLPHVLLFIICLISYQLKKE